MDNVILIAFQLPGRHFLRESNKMLFKIHLSRSADRKMNKKKNKTKKASGVEGSKLQWESGEGGRGRRILAVQYKIYSFF